jgi:hypothetical protein
VKAPGAVLAHRTVSSSETAVTADHKERMHTMKTTRKNQGKVQGPTSTCRSELASLRDCFRPGLGEHSFRCVEVKNTVLGEGSSHYWFECSHIHSCQLLLLAAGSLELLLPFTT